MAYEDVTRVPPLASPSAIDERVGAFLRSVYGWMCAGLLFTAGTAWLVASSPTLVATIFSRPFLLLGLVIVQFGLVIALSARAHRLNPGTAAALFIGYSVLTGVTISAVLLAFTSESVASTFVVTAGMFGALALWGTVTPRSLQGFGQFLFMGLIGVVLASIVGMFWHNDGLQFIISFIGVIVFAGLTAYDAQRLKAMALAMPEGQTGSYAVAGALALYLDFINLFLFLLRFMGNRRN